MVIGFVVIMVILVAWQMLYRPRPRPAPAETPAQAETASANPPGANLTAQPSSPAPAFEPPKKPSPLLAGAAVAETTFVLENDFLRLEFSNVGGVLRSAWLKKYRAELVPEGNTILSTLLLTSGDTLDLSDTRLHAAATDSSVVFTLEADNIALTRKFVIGPDYTVTQQTELSGATGFILNVGAGIAVTEENAKEDLTHFHFFARAENRVQRIAPRSCKNPQTTARADWVGLKSKYFFFAAVSRQHGFQSTCAQALPDGRLGFTASVNALSSELLLYLGPVEYHRLKSFHLGFEEAVSLGWAKPIALGILWLLRLLYRVFRNWGVAIIIFSTIMKAAFYPLTRSQTRQMRQMQLLQPKLNELKAKYKDNPQALNQETMQLYKLYRINPLSGCLPMLVQLPVFWALYTVLRSFVDLRGAGFVLWLKDLSQPDTLFGHLPFLGNPAIGLLPILMGASFIAQNMLTTTDKKNWALTVIFPIFITVMFLNFPSGLQLYWFTYNVLSILESMIGLRGGKIWLRQVPKKAPPSAAGDPR